MPTQIQPLDLLDAKTLVPSDMRTAEWSRVDQWQRERAFYLAGVADAEIAQEARDIVRRASTGEAGEFELRKGWEEFLDGRGYRPLPGQEGTVKDLRSLQRFNVMLRTNVALTHEWARKENALRPGPLRAQPAWELVRIQPAKVPRDWPDRWAASGGPDPSRFGGRMLAPKLSLVWPALGDTARFPDALGVDYPPFAWGSGMGRKLVGAREAMDIGLMTREEIIAQVEEGVARPAHSPGEALQTRPRVEDADLREDLAEQLEGLARWDGDDGRTLVFTDPNGSRPATDDELAATWSQPLPERFRTEDHPAGLFQRDAVLVFAEDPERFVRRTDTDAWDDLARAIERITPAPDRRRVLAALADRDDPSWIERVLRSPLWQPAMEIAAAAPRAVAILQLLRRLF